MGFFKCAFDLLWIWAFDFEIVLFWFGYGLGPGLWFRYGFRYDFDMVWERSGLFGAPDGLAWKQKTEITQGTGLWSISRTFFNGFDMNLIWFWYDCDRILICFWYDLNMVWRRESFFFGFPMGWLEKKQETTLGQAFGRFPQGCLAWFW